MYSISSEYMNGLQRRRYPGIDSDKAVLLRRGNLTTFKAENFVRLPSPLSRVKRGRHATAIRPDRDGRVPRSVNRERIPRGAMSLLRFTRANFRG